MLVTCDNCKKDFEINIFKEQKFISDVGLVYIEYFECDWCKRRYNVTYNNKHTEYYRSKLKFYTKTGNIKEKEKFGKLLQREIRKLQYHWGGGGRKSLENN